MPRTYPSAHRPIASTFLLAALVATGCAGPTPTPRVDAFATDFDGAPRSFPAGWRTATSNRLGAMVDGTWELRADASSPSPPTCFALADPDGHFAEVFNLCWRPDVSVADVDVVVALRADAGEEDRGGGPAWRVVGENDYYLVRWNPLEDNFRVYSVVGGDRVQLDSVRLVADREAWHTIRARMVGDRITCWFDGEELLHARDAKLTSAGGVGLWTKADAATSFDDFAAVPAATPRAEASAVEAPR
ncbi:MAG: hypothetical protein R3F34_14130 [Planctomycetota bacterium]